MPAELEYLVIEDDGVLHSPHPAEVVPNISWPQLAFDCLRKTHDRKIFVIVLLTATVFNLTPFRLTIHLVASGHAVKF